QFDTLTSGGRVVLFASLFCRVCYRVFGMRSVKNGKLFEDQPDRSFCRLAKHALHPVKHGRQMQTTPPARHGSKPQTAF
ncbi:MAG: hypothetical protein R6V15_06630, partial [Desulfotignum sp.]